jgi:hypothetical protein
MPGARGASHLRNNLLGGALPENNLRAALRTHERGSLPKRFHKVGDRLLVFSNLRSILALLCLDQWRGAHATFALKENGLLLFGFISGAQNAAAMAAMVRRSDGGYVI